MKRLTLNGIALSAVCLTMLFGAPALLAEAETSTAAPEVCAPVPVVAEAFEAPLPAELVEPTPTAMAVKGEPNPQYGGACQATCPGSSQHNIPPYTIRCGQGQSCGGVVYNSQGEVCALICDGFGKECFPNGCF